MHNYGYFGIFGDILKFSFFLQTNLYLNGLSESQIFSEVSIDFESKFVGDRD